MMIFFLLKLVHLGWILLLKGVYRDFNSFQERPSYNILNPSVALL